jgi:hypothetical protein
MNSTLAFILARLKEPSTFASIAAGLTAAQAVPDTATKVVVIGAALAGVFASEKKPA